MSYEDAVIRNGNKGTIILVDTKYIHRDNIIQYGERKTITIFF